MDRPHTAAVTASSSTASPSGFIRSRIANACDGCKARKVKCDGRQPCSYCVRRQRPHACHYTPQRRARQRRPAAAQLPHSPPPSAVAARSTRATPRGGDSSVSGTAPDGQGSGAARRQSSMESPEGDTEVPREARLLCDAQGKLIFIGDCAPLSFFQSIRQLVTSCVSQNAFAPETSRYSVLENAIAGQTSSRGESCRGPPDVSPMDVQAAVSSYISTTTGLVDLFDESKLTDDLVLWSNIQRKPQTLESAINYLILAIGRQRHGEYPSQTYYEYAKDQAFQSLSGDLSVGTVQAFVLVTIYMLCSCQINSAFLVFGVAVRAAYSIGVHRTEVNARFGPEIHRQRDRLWKSLRAVDLFLSTSMGRPPATSDVDCTVPYRTVDDNGNETFDILNSSVQILLIIEVIVLEVYSRKKISLQLTEGISLQLREWSARWLQRLKDVVAQRSDHSHAQISGACQVLSSYYYAVMLVSRPFLMYELFRRLSDNTTPAGRPPALTSGRSKLADACIDAASLMVDPILGLIEQRVLTGRMPLLVSWLFASSLVLGVGLLGGFGRILEKHTRMSIQVLDHFAQSDTHATQYSLIAQSLLTTALEHLEKLELQERLRRTETSSQLFGLVPRDPRPGGSDTRSPARPLAHAASPAVSSARGRDSLERSSFLNQPSTHQTAGSPRLGDIDSAFFGLSESLAGQDGNLWNPYQGNDAPPGSALNLFPLLDAGGGIDLAHYL